MIRKDRENRPPNPTNINLKHLDYDKTKKSNVFHCMCIISLYLM